ncbi:MAG: VanZ family protein [Gaiellaceae bacterium]
MPRDRFASSWLPVVLWLAVIFVLSSIPSLSSGLGVWDLVGRKLAHTAEYAVLGALLARALPELPALAAGSAYAVTDEVHQSFVAGRHGALLDVAIDAAGVLVGILLLRRLRR